MQKDKKTENETEEVINPFERGDAFNAFCPFNREMIEEHKKLAKTLNWGKSKKKPE